MSQAYQQAFEKLKKKKEGALIPFTVIGDPDYAASLEIVKTMVDAGADILELGFPFSDPIADGPTIQAADTRALANGITIDDCFRFIREVRKFTSIPIGLLVYYNLIYQRGLEKFFEECKEAGVSSVLSADVPIEESAVLLSAARKHEIDTVFIVSPLTEGDRLEHILKECRGFVYVVSRLGVTGARDDLQSSTLEMIRKLKKKTSLPLCVGFGISKSEHVKQVLHAGADGVIVGSALVKIIEKNTNNKTKLLHEVKEYVKQMKSSTLF